MRKTLPPGRRNRKLSFSHGGMEDSYEREIRIRCQRNLTPHTLNTACF